MKKTIYSFLAATLLAAFSPNAMGSNLTITNVVVNQTTQNITFDMSWDNSFRLAVAPANWDAIWVFVKFRDCAATAATPFTHGTLHATTANHSYTNLEAMTTPCTQSVGGCTAAGDVTQSAAQGVTMDFTTGILLRRSTVGSGTTTSAVSLRVTNLPAVGTTITTKVMGIEMVYCPQGDFALGDGGPGPVGSASRFLSSAVNTAVPATITSAYEVTGGAAQTMYYLTAATVRTVVAVPLAWPKGQYGFYIMKYEITQGLYVEFLNTIGGVAQAARFPGNVGTNRNQTQSGPGANVYSTPRPDRAQNFLNWADLAAFLDWASLRPMTEAEYEKACRGSTTYVTGEYAWGTTAATLVGGGTFTAPGAENGTETISSPVGANVHIHSNASVLTNGDGGDGPIRAGIFATSTSTRAQAGATYFGAMDMTGNVTEMCVAIHLTAASNVFKRIWGDGAIVLATGIHDVTDWPASAAAIANASTGNLVGQRGGYFNGAFNDYAVSSRYEVYDVNDCDTRGAGQGGRGVR